MRLVHEQRLAQSRYKESAQQAQSQIRWIADPAHVIIILHTVFVVGRGVWGTTPSSSLNPFSKVTEKMFGCQESKISYESSIVSCATY